MECQMYSSKDILGVIPVVNHDGLQDKNRPVTRPASLRYRPAWPDRFFHYLWWQKNRKTWSGHARLCTRLAIEGSLLSVWVSQSINRSWLMDIATFSTRDLWEQGCKSYVASYRANEELVIPRMFSRELHQWRWFAKDFFHERFPIYGKFQRCLLLTG